MSTFWNDASFEPKRNYRFQVTIGNSTTPANMGGVQFWAKTCDTPSFDVTEVEHNYYDNKYYYPGRVIWNTISMTVVDPVDVNICYALCKSLQDANYNVKANTNDRKSISKGTATTSLGDAMTIRVFSAAGDKAVEEWTLNNFFLQSAKFGSLDYSSDELKQIDMTFRYDWASIEDTLNAKSKLFVVATNNSSDGSGGPNE